jgi:RNA polymerase sigma factor (sigma-70 family)
MFAEYAAYAVGSPDRLKQRNVIAMANIRLVILQANKYYRTTLWDVDINDLISAGFQGLLKAIDNYKPQPNPHKHFANYAVWYIKGAIIKFLSREAHIIKSYAPVDTVLDTASYGLDVLDVLEMMVDVGRTTPYLPSVEQRVITMVLNGLTKRQIASELGYQVRWIEILLARAIKRLQKFLHTRPTDIAANI